MEPAAREVQGVAGPHRHVEHRLAGLAQLGRVLLAAQRQLEDRRIDEPALLARHLETEDVVRVVMDLEPLGRRRRVVGVRLGGVAELALEIAAEARQRWVMDVQRLEHDRRAPLELGGDAFDLGGRREGLRRPGDVLGVVAERCTSCPP